MDPTSRRSTPPPHPAGYPALEDAPVHLAPAVDVRETVRRAREELLGGTGVGGSRSWPTLSIADAARSERSSAEPPGPEEAPAIGTTAPMGLPREASDEPTPPSASGGSLYTLAFPVEERRSRPPGAGGWERRPESTEPAEPMEPSPQTVAFEPKPWHSPRAAQVGRPSSGARGEAGEPEPIEPSPQTVAFEDPPRPAWRPEAEEPMEPSPRTVAFEMPQAIVPRAPIAIGGVGGLQPEPWPQPETWSQPEPWPQPQPEPEPEPQPQPIALARPWPAPRLESDMEAAPESALPPSVVLPMSSFAPEAAMPPALAHLVSGPDPTGERVAIARDLASIGALDERPDREVEREVGAKATLARARTLRYRLTLLDAFEALDALDAPENASPLAGSIPPGVVPIDLAIDAALLVGFADGAPFVRHAAAGAELPFVRALASFMRSARPDVPRSVLRERGAASIARLTIAGYRSALDALARSAREITLDGRVLALDAAAFAALAPAANDHRLGALTDLERAMGLRTGSVAQALELAHRRRR
jgi:hypothetical protein